MDIDIKTIKSGPARALLFFDFMFEALHEDQVTSKDRTKFNYYVRPYQEAREQNLPIEPEKQYQVLLQLQDSHGFTVEEGLSDLKPGHKVRITITDRDLFIDSYNQSITNRNIMLKNLDPVVKEANDKAFFDMLNNADKKANRLKLYLGDSPRAVYRTRSAPITRGTKRYAILEYMQGNKNHPEAVNDFKNVVNQKITDGHAIKAFGDVDDAIRALKSSLGLKSGDYFPIVTDGFKRTVTWIEK